MLSWRRLFRSNPQWSIDLPTLNFWLLLLALGAGFSPICLLALVVRSHFGAKAQSMFSDGSLAGIVACVLLVLISGVRINLAFIRLRSQTQAIDSPHPL